MIFDTTFDYVKREYGSEGEYFVEKCKIVFSNNEKKLYIMKGKVYDRDQIFYYKDSTNYVIGFNIAYLQNIPSENKFYEDVELKVKGDKIYKDDIQVNFDYCKHSLKSDDNDNRHPIYIVEYIDNEYNYLVIDGNHRISYMLDNKIEKIEVRLIDTVATILTIYNPNEMFIYAILNIYRLINMQNFNQEKFKRKILFIIRAVNYCYKNRYKKFCEHIHKK